MSAVYGCIDLLKNNIEQSIESTMRDTYKKCVIDRFSHVVDKEVMLGCGIQYFTEEAKQERLPIVQDQIYFTADVYLDNREELLELLKIDKNATIPDGDILFQVYHQYGRDGLDQVLGSFTFVYYDAESQYVDLVVDATGNRTLYYTIQENVLYVSTMMKTLVAIQNKPQLSERWITGYLGRDDYQIFMDTESTPYQDIWKVANAQIVRITKDKITKDKYWKPLEHRKSLKLESDEAYKKVFKQAYQESVRQTLRSGGETGIFLSGGLDSTSVACLAAPMLKQQNKDLYAYTMTPEEGYVGPDNHYLVYDETAWVRETADFLGNVKTHFMNFHGKNCWNIMEEMTEIFEVPYKSLENPMWLFEMAKQAYSEGCRVVLNGQIGNNSVSFGDMSTIYSTLLRQGKWLQLKKELDACKDKYGFSRKNLLKKLCSIQKNRKLDPTLKMHLFENTVIRQELVDKYQFQETLWEDKKAKQKITTMDEYYAVMFDEIYFRHVGEFETHQSLYSGVLIKDPTRNKRLMELIASFPIRQFVYQGCQRRLVRDYLKEEMPMKFVQDFRHRGRQAEDTFYRLEGDWKQILESIEGMHIKNSKYVDEKKMTDAIEKMYQYKDLASISPEQRANIEKVLQVVIVDTLNKRIA